MKRIPLTQGKFAIVDDADFEWLNQWKWCALKNRNTFYAIRSEGKCPHQKVILMHRQILNFPKGFETDHINRNGLDNRRQNLRICTTAQNQWNAKRKAVGAHFHEKHNKWHARIRHNGKKIHLGCYVYKDEAMRAYQEARTKLRGAFLGR
jgi:hypothetical protein